MESIDPDSQNLQLLLQNYLEAEKLGNYDAADEIIDNKVPELGKMFFQKIGIKQPTEEQQASFGLIFSSCTSSSIPENEKNKYISFRVEQLKNSILLQKNFEEKSKQFVLENQGDPDTIELSSADTHHGGKVPFSCTIKGRKVFIKPRSAALDISIINLFSEINTLEPNFHLPVYSIEDINDFSKWDLIDGHLPGEEYTIIEDFVDKLKPNDRLSREDIANIKDQLLKLNAVASRIGLSDLHGENVIFKNLSLDEVGRFIKKNIDDPVIVVPIDLESLQPGSATGLLREKEADQPVDLSEAALEKINSFNENVKKIPFRFVPIPTVKFLENLDNVQNIPKVIELVQKSASKKNMQINFDLKDYITKCFLNKEVPFFSCIDGILYPGAK
ncbi:MAG: DUF4135 domain-containing protein [Bacteroidetes bacterium]|nr:DUF4135 domain-containing protein [Bacteroidota bacterium]